MTRSDTSRTGLLYGIATYLLWGAFPLYFILFTRSSAFEIVAHRAFWSLIFCAILLTIMRSWRSILAHLRDRRTLLTYTVAGFLIVANWTTYVYGIAIGRTLDASLGYFINPLVTAMLGVLVLGERMRRLQWVAFALAGSAIIVNIVAYGEFPWIALLLAGTFGCYSLVKKVGGRSVDALSGLAIETAVVAPFALAFIVVLMSTGRSSFTPDAYGLLLISTGAVTAIPLLLFAAATRRVTLVTMAILQFMTPIIVFLQGWILFDEPMPLSRWVGFILVWCAVALFIVDLAQASRGPRVVRAEGEPAGADSSGEDPIEPEYLREVG